MNHKTGNNKSILSERMIKMDTKDVITKPYMGNLTNQQIGNMAKSGQLGGEMVKRMIASQEEELMNQYNQNPLNN